MGESLHVAILTAPCTPTLSGVALIEGSVWSEDWLLSFSLTIYLFLSLSLSHTHTPWNPTSQSVTQLPHLPTSTPTRVDRWSTKPNSTAGAHTCQPHQRRDSFLPLLTMDWELSPPLLPIRRGCKRASVYVRGRRYAFMKHLPPLIPHPDETHGEEGKQKGWKMATLCNGRADNRKGPAAEKQKTKKQRQNTAN